MHAVCGGKYGGREDTDGSQREAGPGANVVEVEMGNVGGTILDMSV